MTLKKALEQLQTLTYYATIKEDPDMLDAVHLSMQAVKAVISFRLGHRKTFYSPLPGETTPWITV